MWLRSVLALLALCLFLTAPATFARPLPEGVTEQHPVTLIYVKKSERRLSLIDDRGMVVRTYPIMLGKNPVGPKQEAGDSRTPEGRYTIDARNPNSSFFLSLRIAYPGPQDVARAKAAGVSPGRDIFIHGKPNGKEWQFWKYKEGNDWTEGCIALTNENMREIWDMVAEGTEIVIDP